MNNIKSTKNIKKNCILQVLVALSTWSSMQREMEKSVLTYSLGKQKGKILVKPETEGRFRRILIYCKFSNNLIEGWMAKSQLIKLLWFL